jgi:K+-transporting ATPase A subunit
LVRFAHLLVVPVACASSGKQSTPIPRLPPAGECVTTSTVSVAGGVVVKACGVNGGGYYNVNSAHPNP